MSRTIRTGLAAVASCALAVAMALPSAAVPAPLRSGKMLGGLFLAGDASDCRHLPDCMAWLESDCDPDLARRNPAWQTSIVNVAALSDDSTLRQFRWDVDGPQVRSNGWWLGTGVGWGGVVVQFWGADCSEITVSKWRSSDPHTHRQVRDADIAVPSTAEWMTVATLDTINIAWTLT